MGDLDDLVSRARRGDGAAFAALFDRFHPIVFRFLAARLGDRDLAEDLAAEVFVEVAERLHRFRGGGSDFRAWLFTIARHDLADLWRASARRKVTPMAVVPARPDDGSVEDLVSLRLDTTRMQHALHRLTSDQRDVVLLRFAAGLSLQETADTLGKPLTAVKSLQHRALATMRRVLVGEGVERP